MQLNALKYLWYLLPDSNRDTLQYLLRFLSKVAEFAEDTTGENDQIVSQLLCQLVLELKSNEVLHTASLSLPLEYVYCKS